MSPRSSTHPSTSTSTPRRHRRARALAVAAAPLAAAAVLAATLPAVAAPAPAAAVSAACPTGWGSLAEQGSTADPVIGADLVAVRTGEHPCYDRLVLDVTGARPLTTWSVRYVDAVFADGSGRPVPLRGGARLLVTVGASSALAPTAREVADVSGYRTSRQVGGAGSFEGVTGLGLGVRARLPFRVLTVAGVPGSPSGTRLVVDVAHTW